MLEWIGRFRFVDAGVLAERFGVSRQQVNARLRRLEEAGLVVRRAERTSAAWTVGLSARGALAVGQPPRRPARTGVQREHELAIAWLLARLENQPDPPPLYTERECRTREAAGAGRYSADILEPGSKAARRWPDLVAEPDGRRIAIELELTGKGTARLRRIVAGYRAARWFDEVRFLAADAAIARRLTGVIAATQPQRAAALFPQAGRCAIRVEPWPISPDDEHRWL